MPRNTQARDHVLSPAQIPTRSDSNAENITPNKSEKSTQQEEEGIEVASPLSRKEKRRLKNLDNSTSLPRTTESTASNNPSIRSKRPSNNACKQKINSPTSTTLSVPVALAGHMPLVQYYPLLVCSIGNPGAQYANTLHSAGHTILSVLQSRGIYQPFQKGLSGLIARPITTRWRGSIFGYSRLGSRDLEPGDGQDDFTLWQSLSLMNVSGQAVKKAWTQFQIETKRRGWEPRLVVVHDELEADFGLVRVKDGASSPRGHNGLKSIQAALGNKVKWWRVGVGIGRPETRDPAVVSKYVLRKMTVPEEKEMVFAAHRAQKLLQNIADGSA
ncbi:peptidyl-tRNA hydrolase [Lojkania enalia]|uniref:peptidyl-tRNA hydrolase n=1 Tax=Lojkania enalia TaxID=147567 RepID=A0A9P4K8P9_9PLEO|nr:peptidyl-tRNA hydrolase [Didymosphaeria enalia]